MLTIYIHNYIIPFLKFIYIEYRIIFANVIFKYRLFGLGFLYLRAAVLVFIFYKYVFYNTNTTTTTTNTNQTNYYYYCPFSICLQEFLNDSCIIPCFILVSDPPPHQLFHSILQSYDSHMSLL